MNNYSVPTSIKKSLVKPIFITGLVAGTLDAMGAIVVYQANPLRMFQYIASGAIGRDAAFSGEWVTALAGVLFHYAIATFWAALFLILFPKIQKLHLNKYVLGIGYGVVVWLAMNLVVLPLSTIGMGTFSVKGALIGISILMVAIGMPISIMTHRFYKSLG